MRHVDVQKYTPDRWLKNIVNISQLPSIQKYQALIKLHSQTFSEYKKDISAMTEEEAESKSSDGRIRKIVVAHIMGWEEFQIQVFEDKDPLTRLHKQLNFQGYVDPATRQSIDFFDPYRRSNGVNKFNAYQAEKYNNWSWHKIMQRAISTGQRLKNCFPDKPSKQFLNFLESTPLKRWKLKEDLVVTIPAGFYLWMVSLKHEAIEHRQDIVLIK